MLHALRTGVAQPVPVDVASIDRGALGRVTTRGAPTARTTLTCQRLTRICGGAGYLLAASTCVCS